MSVRLWRKFKYPLNVIFLSTTLHFVIDFLLSSLARLSLRIPSTSPRNYTGSHSAEIYSNLSSPKVAINEMDIQFNKVSFDLKVEEIDPYSELYRFSLAQSLLINILILLSLSLFLFFVIGQKANSSRDLNILVSAFLFNMCCSLVFFKFVAGSSSGHWDEVFVFASGATNLANGGLPAVPVSGPIGYADSSVDLGIVLAGGGLLWLFPFLQAETALIFGYICLLFAINTWIYMLLVKSFKVPNSFSYVITGMTSFFLPVTYLTTSNGIPTGVAVSSFVLFALVTWDLVVNRRYVNYALGTLLAGIIRWEYGLLAALLSIGMLILDRDLVLRATQFQKIVFFFPIGFFVTTTLLRKNLYDSYLPSGAISKSVGIDGTYLSGGFQYLRSTSESMLWPFLLSMCLIIAFPIARLINKRLSVYVFLLLLTPLITGIFTGGDWFPTNWARYLMPPIISLFVLSIALLWSSSRQIEFKRISTYMLIATLIVTQLGMYQILFKAVETPHVFARTNCLARAGLLLKEILPPGESIATAEVNTLAYFADRPLTDLVGLVDSRVAEVEATPLAAGDVLHRRANPTVIQEDRPAVIYLYEGANCSMNQDLSDESNALEWERLLNGEFGTISRFRAGNVKALLENYSPKTYFKEGELILRVLVRNDINGVISK
jgi:hypothetical protein